MGTKKNEGFHQRSEEGDLGKSDFSGLGGVLETSLCSTMLQEVRILPTLVYSYFCGLISTPPSSSPVEQVIMNLSKVVGSFVEE